VITVVPAHLDDVPGISDLLVELDGFYGDAPTDPPERRREVIAAQLFGPDPAGRVLLAKDGADLVGLAAFSYLWPAAGITRSLFLKELYVRQHRRDEGIGSLLVREVCRAAVAAGCSRVEWHADLDNPGAQRFYEALGVPPQDGKLFYRLDRDSMGRLLDQDVSLSADTGPVG
jgi:GNAT superfamily N-acetyltransferase